VLSRLVHSERPDELRRGLHWLYGFVRPQRRAIAGLLLLSLCATLLVLLQPWLTKMLIDDGLLARDYPTLVAVACGMVLAGIAGTVLAGVNRQLHTRLSGRILFALRSDLYRHLQTLSPAFYGRQRMGDLMSRLDGDVAEIQRFAVDSLFAAVSSLIGLFGALALMLSLSWQLSLLVLVLVPVEAAWLRWMRRKVEARTRTVRERAADVSSFLVETLPAMKFIQASRREADERARLDGLGGRYLDDLLRLQRTEFFTQAVPSTLTSLTRAAAFLIGGWWVIEGSWQLGALIAFSTYLGMATGPVNSLLGLYVAIQRMSVSLMRVSELREAAADVVEDAASAQAVIRAWQGRIEFEEVVFRHQGRAEAVLDGARLTIPAGSKLALTGASGAGKSTLIDLLHRHYDPYAGSIRLDGVDLRAIPLGELRRAVAVVSQDIVLFRGTLAENIRYAAPQADDEAVRAAARRAHLDALVASLPQGLDTPLGERGQQLSGGQRQRIAIARALLQDPCVLVMDEATSAVDEATEAAIIAEVDALFAGRTRILISHRAATLAGCDVRVRLASGRLEVLPLPAEMM
jgi:ATP-binding cassette subfamily B protein